MSVNNPWLSPFERSFSDIKNKLIEKLKLKVPEITNFSESNIFIRLISIFAAIAEILHYYIDNVSRETFFVSARKYSSLIRHAKLIDYNIKSANPASVDILIYTSDGLITTNDINIPVGTEFTSTIGLVFITTRSFLWAKGTYAINISATQLEYVLDVSFGNVASEDVNITLGELGQGNYYCEGSMSLRMVLTGVTTSWKLVETFAYSKPTDCHYKVVLDQDQEPWIVFGNGNLGKKPDIGCSVIGSYATTKGSYGNIEPGTITSLPVGISTQGINLICINREKASAGTDYEDFNMLKEHIPLHLRSLGVAISEEDYISVAKTLPGVDKAYVKQECGKNVSVYITPDGGGIASQELLISVRDKLLTKKVLGTSLDVIPANESLIFISATVSGNPSFKSNDIYKQVTNGLISRFDYNNSDIGKPVRLSELYAFIESLSMVDYLNIDNLFLKPVPIAYSGAVSLNFDINIVSINADISYLLRYNQPSGYFELITISGQLTGETIPYAGTNSNWKTLTNSGDNWLIRILPSLSGEYVNGNIWKISLLKNKVDQVSPELAIPLFKANSQITLSIIEKI